MDKATKKTKLHEAIGSISLSLFNSGVGSKNLKFQKRTERLRLAGWPFGRRSLPDLVIQAGVGRAGGRNTETYFKRH
jgi:hypothetical protein